MQSLPQSPISHHRLPLYEGVDWNPCRLIIKPSRNRVSLFTREWIEIANARLSTINRRCLPLYEGVDWNLIASHFSLQLSICLPLYEGVDWNFFFAALQCECLQGLPLYEGVDWNSALESQNHPYEVSLFTREWIEITSARIDCRHRPSLPLYEGVDWNSNNCASFAALIASPSLRGSGLKYFRDYPNHLRRSLPLYEGVDWNIGVKNYNTRIFNVSLFTREWIEIKASPNVKLFFVVSLFTREWIEIAGVLVINRTCGVSLFTREWIEISIFHHMLISIWVSLFTREWIEITSNCTCIANPSCLPLYEGVDWNRYSWTYDCRIWQSPSLRGSGLKWYQSRRCHSPALPSPSLRGSGLKYRQKDAFVR